MDLVTAHISADFDCLAAMAAAEKLYPGAVCIFPGSQEPSVREYLGTGRCPVRIQKIRQIDLDAVRRLIVVDTQSKDRIGNLAALLDRPAMEVHVYDHHAKSDRDFRADVARVRPVGATTTILVSLLKEQGVSFGSEEATLFNLGIHEDTHSFSSSSTTPEDMEAASFLLSQGADPTAVIDLLQRDLNSAQVSLLHELMESAEEIRISGTTVALSVASREQYVDDIALVAQKFRSASDVQAFFLLVRMGDKIQLVARSRSRKIDAGAVATTFGGGGHPSAASASIRELTLFQARDQLLEHLQRERNRNRTVGDVMVSTVRTVRADAAIRDAEQWMTRYGLNVLPVMEKEHVVGLINRPVVEKAIFHGLGQERIGDYMSRDFETLAPEASAERALEMILSRRQKLIPILAKDGKAMRLEGIIARGDILRYLHEEGSVEEIRAKPHTRGVKTLVRDRLSRDLFMLLERAAETADESGCTVHLVGGIVRDLLLGIENVDVDLVVEGDGIAFARRLADREAGRCRVHPRYGTAVITLPDGKRIDVATARTEYYEQPAALPVVEMSDIRTDLYRRDFSINAMAVQLNGRRAWRLLDFFGSRRDLKEKVLRVLHNLSFVEDPTRAFRAVRFAERYGLTIGAQTVSLLENAVRNNLFDRLSGKRLFAELQLILSEAEPWRYIARLSRLRLLRFIHPKLRETPVMRRRFRGIDQAIAWYKLLFIGHPIEDWQVYFLGLCEELSPDDMESACRRLAMPGRLRERARQARREVVNLLAELTRPEAASSTVYRVLHPLAHETLLYALAAAPSQQAKKNISLYLTHLKDVKPSIGGDDLISMGVEPGPLYRELLDAARDALLDGDVEPGEAHERAYVRRLLALHASD